ncbi:MAG: hypothetical protein ACI8RZ_006676 [Myxococcota bacterium]|jgi:hypothetical protein
MTRILALLAFSFTLSVPAFAACTDPAVCNPAGDLGEYISCVLMLEDNNCIRARTCQHNEEWYDVCVPTEDETDILCFNWNESSSSGKVCIQ